MAEEDEDEDEVDGLDELLLLHAATPNAKMVAVASTFTVL
jgi:hypothetical protein